MLVYLFQSLGELLISAPCGANLSQLLGLPASSAPWAGTLPTHTPLFIGFLLGTVIVVGALTFFPVLALGPIVEHLQLLGR